MNEFVYVFNGEKAALPAGIFTEFDLAKAWIEKNKLSGILNKYPINIGIYDWAVLNEFFVPKTTEQQEARFIEGFSCASIEHWHFEYGKSDEEIS